MAIQYNNGATADCPVIKAIEAELSRLDEVADNWKSNGLTVEDLEIILVKRATVLDLYRSFAVPYEVVFLYAEEGSN